MNNEKYTEYVDDFTKMMSFISVSVNDLDENNNGFSLEEILKQTENFLKNTKNEIFKNMSKK